MQFFTTVFLSAIIGLVAAAPSEIEARGSTTVFYCTSPDLKGPCNTVSISSGTCVDVDGNYAGQVKSFLPSGTKCTIYSGTGCSGSSLDVGPEGAFNLGGSEAYSYNCQSYRDAWGWGW